MFDFPKWLVNYNMHKLETKLKDLILKNLEFVVDEKCIKKGKVKVFNIKQFFIRFKLETDTKTYEYDLPYPYKVIEIKDGYIFDYCLSAFCPRTEEAFWKMKAMDRSECSKIYDNYLHIKALSS